MKGFFVLKMVVIFLLSGAVFAQRGPETRSGKPIGFPIVGDTLQGWDEFSLDDKYDWTKWVVEVLGSHEIPDSIVQSPTLRKVMGRYLASDATPEQRQELLGMLEESRKQAAGKLPEKQVRLIDRLVKGDQDTTLASEYLKAGKTVKKLNSRRQRNLETAQEDALKAIQAIQESLSTIKKQPTIGVPDIEKVEGLLNEATQKLKASGCIADAGAVHGTGVGAHQNKGN